ncbi:MAG: hypothetical protein GY733_03380 [bacterium]|nr:hypothetical protein [bacterium]
MSILRGEPGSVWTLPSAVDALAVSARRAGRPGAIWLAGLGYQFLNFGWIFGATIAVPVAQKALPEVFDGSWWRVRPILGWDLLSLVSDHGASILIGGAPFLLIFFRFVAGLARISPEWVARGPEHERRPGLRHAWREGKRLTLSALGLWTQILLMMFGATLLFIGPIQLFLQFVGWEANPITAVLAGVAAALMLIYGFLLSILFQIALHSLVQNRRGVASALLHAWRIAKNDPLATARATIVDLVLYITTIVIPFGIATLLVALLGLADSLVLLPLMVLDGFAGCTRCAYWGRAYRALGGLSTLDDVPG